MAFLPKWGLIHFVEKQFVNYRHYTRWSHRRPKRVLTPEEYTEMESQYINKNEASAVLADKTNSGAQQKLPDFTHKPNTLDKTKQRIGKWVPKQIKSEIEKEDLPKVGSLSDLEKTLNPKGEVHRRKKKQIYKTMHDEKTKSVDMLETIIDADGNFVYTKLPNKDAGLSQLLLTVKSRKEQQKKDMALLEGKRLIKEALEANCKLQSLVFSRISDLEYLKPFMPQSGAKLYKIPYKEIQMWSDLSTAPGVMGIFKTPDVAKFVPPEDSLKIIIVCDNVREPGNLGAILRTAVGVGVQSVFLTKGCVDLWDTKVLRSACGAHFQLQIHKKLDWTDIKTRVADLNGSVLIADNKVTTDDLTNITNENLEDTISSLPLLPYYSANFGELGTLVLIVGGETEGISGDAYRFAAEYSGLRLNIPLSNNVDSLNTGTSLGIILFEIKRQLTHLKYQVGVKV